MSRFFAHLFSTFGHPMLVPTYALLILMSANPYAFGVHDPGHKKALLLLLYVFTTTALIPGIGIAIMKPLGFVRSLESPDRQERIGPYIITGIFYLWLYQNLKSSGQAPPLYQACVLGATIALFGAFFINIFRKVSAHATGMGGLVGMLVLLSVEWPGGTLGFGFFGGLLEISQVAALGIGVMIAGCVGTARLVLRAHIPPEVWQGYIVGLGAMWLAWLVVL
jgi:hypothetical protein